MNGLDSGGASDDNYKLETPEGKSTNPPLNNSNEGDKNVCN